MSGLRRNLGSRASQIPIWQVASLLILVACGPLGSSSPSNRARPKPGVEITLYRDHAVVAHRIDVVIPAAAPATLRLRIAAGVDADELYLVEKGELLIKEVRIVGSATDKPAEGCDEVSCVLDNYENKCCAKFERKPSEWDDDASKVVASTKLPSAPVDVELTVTGPRAGTYSMLVGYQTARLDWDAAYTLITAPERDRAQLRGALAVRNATGVAFPDAKLAVVDGQHGVVTDRLAAKLRGETNTSPVAEPRELGRTTLVEGDTRVDLIDDVVPRRVRSVLVFDPIGPGLDYQHGQPVQDPNLGITPPPSTQVTESLEIDRVPALQHLPGGPVRLLERRSDGTLAVLGAATLFGEATLAAHVDTISIGTADKVTGTRERRELTIDNDRRRLVEEFALTIDNARDQPIEVLLREHLYRGETWTIAYQSTYYVAQEGKQQFAMRTKVSAHAKQRVLYVVVYRWDVK